MQEQLKKLEEEKEAMAQQATASEDDQAVPVRSLSYYVVPLH